MKSALSDSGVALVLIALALALSGTVWADGLPRFTPHVDLKTFMGHIVSPAAMHIWSVNGIVIDAQGEHDLAPKTEADWEELVSATATLAESTNALLIPQRELDGQWNHYVRKLADAANTAYLAAEAHDLKAIAAVSDQLDGICASCHRHYKLE